MRRWDDTEPKGKEGRWRGEYEEGWSKRRGEREWEDGMTKRGGGRRGRQTGHAASHT